MVIIAKKGGKLQLRIYFPLLKSRQLITGVNTAYSQEINKLRAFGIKHITPYLARMQYKAWPFIINFTFHTYDDTDMISALTTASYIVHLFENNATLQSTDARVLPKISIEIQKTHERAAEGCTISIERYIKPKK